MITRWCLLIGALIWAAPVHAQVVFSEDFEVTLGALHSNPLTQPVADLLAKGWTNFIEADRNADVAAIVSKTSRTGATSKVLRYSYDDIYPGRLDIQNVKLTRFFPGITELWTRGWYRWEVWIPGKESYWVQYPHMASAKQIYFNPGIGETVGGSVGFSGNYTPNELISSTSTLFTRTCPNGSVQQTCSYLPNQTHVPMTLHASPSDRPTQWACVEVHWKFNNPVSAANGILELYVNGILTTRYMDVMFANAAPSGSQTNTFRYVQEYRQSAQNMLRYTDDFAISTARIGCGASRSLDTQPPTGPTGLKLN